MIPSVLELLMSEQSDLYHELDEVEDTITTVTYVREGLLNRQERKGVLRVLEARRIEVLAELALGRTAISNTL